MSLLPEERHLVLLLLGGFLLPFVVGLSTVGKEFSGVAAIAPLLLGIGVFETYRTQRQAVGNAGKVGLLLTTIGFALSVIAALLFAVAQPTLALNFVLAIPIAAGSMALVGGSLLLAIAFRTAGRISILTALLLGTGVLPLIWIVFSTTFGSPSLPFSGITTALLAVPYGVGWVRTATQLSTDAHTDIADASQRRGGATVSLHVLTTGLVGGLLALISIGRYLPLGPISAIPWVGETAILNLLHFTVGLLGITIAVSRMSKRAHHYERVVGVGAFSLVGIILFGTVLSLPGFEWLTGTLGLLLTDVIFYFAIGILLVTLGYGVGTDDSQ